MPYRGKVITEEDKQKFKAQLRRKGHHKSGDATWADPVTRPVEDPTDEDPFAEISRLEHYNESTRNRNND